jgi:hypothetical protein
MEEVSKMMQDPTTVIYTDTSTKYGNFGAAVIKLDANGMACKAGQIAVGPN